MQDNSINSSYGLSELPIHKSITSSEQSYLSTDMYMEESRSISRSKQRGLYSSVDSEVFRSDSHNEDDKMIGSIESRYENESETARIETMIDNLSVEQSQSPPPQLMQLQQAVPYPPPLQAQLPLNTQLPLPFPPQTQPPPQTLPIFQKQSPPLQTQLPLPPPPQIQPPPPPTLPIFQKQSPPLQTQLPLPLPPQTQSPPSHLKEESETKTKSLTLTDLPLPTSVDDINISDYLDEVKDFTKEDIYEYIKQSKETVTCSGCNKEIKKIRSFGNPKTGNYICVNCSKEVEFEKKNAGEYDWEESIDARGNKNLQCDGFRRCTRMAHLKRNYSFLEIDKKKGKESSTKLLKIEKQCIYCRNFKRWEYYRNNTTK